MLEAGSVMHAWFDPIAEIVQCAMKCRAQSLEVGQPSAEGMHNHPLRDEAKEAVK